MTSECHCDAKDVPHVHDWQVTFAAKVAEERDYSARHPGHVFLVCLHRDEAEGLLASITAAAGADTEKQT